MTEAIDSHPFSSPDLYENKGWEVAYVTHPCERLSYSDKIPVNTRT